MMKDKDTRPPRPLRFYSVPARAGLKVTNFTKSLKGTRANGPWTSFRDPEFLHLGVIHATSDT